MTITSTFPSYTIRVTATMYQQMTPPPPSASSPSAREHSHPSFPQSSLSISSQLGSFLGGANPATGPSRRPPTVRPRGQALEPSRLRVRSVARRPRQARPRPAGETGESSSRFASSGLRPVGVSVSQPGLGWKPGGDGPSHRHPSSGKNRANAKSYGTPRRRGEITLSRAACERFALGAGVGTCVG